MELQALPFLAVVGFLQHINNQIQILVSHDELGGDEPGGGVTVDCTLLILFFFFTLYICRHFAWVGGKSMGGF